MIIDRRRFLMSVGVGSVASGCGPKVKSFPSGANKRVDAHMIGLIGVVRGESTVPLRLLLVDGQSTLSVPHDPLLLIPTSSSQSSTVPKLKTAPRPQSTEVCDYYDLKGYDVVVDSGLATGPRVTAVTGHRQPGHQAPSAGEEDDVSWIADMKLIPGVTSGQINPACIGSGPTPLHVAARIRFDVCEVASAFPPRYKDKVFRIGSGAGAYTQALGIPAIRAAATASGLTLTFTTFTGAPGGTISVKSGSMGSPTHIYVFNEPHTEVRCATDDDLRNLMHFQAFYKLLATPLASGPIPMCVGSNCPVCPPIPPGATAAPTSSQDIHCPSGGYEP